MGNTQSRTNSYEAATTAVLSPQESSLSQLFARERDHGERERTVEGLEHRREAKAERDARRAERDRQAREYERQRSMREEHVDAGYLCTQGVYTGVEDYSKPIVRQMMIERRLAPFWRGLQEFSPSWTEAQLVAMARGKPLPAADEIPESEPEPEPEQGSETERKASTTDFAEQVLHNLTVPLSSRAMSTSPDGRAWPPDSRLRSRTTEATPDFHLREIKLPENSQVNGQPVEAYLYKDSTECPICFLYYPNWINKTRCCLQEICSECFVQVARKPPHLPDGQENNENQPEQEQQLISEPASCPYCSTPDLGVFYIPPPFSPRGLAYSGGARGATLGTNNGRKRATSLAATDPNVVTTDQIRPGWELKLAQVRAETLRRSAAATALHHAAFLTRGADSRLFGRRTVLGRGESPMSSSAHLTLLAAMAERYNAANQEVAEAEAASPTITGPPRHSSRRNRVEDLEEMMMMEAIRLSLAAEQDRQQREERKEQKDKKKADKQKAKDEKKAEKAAKKGGLYLTSTNSSSQLDSDRKGKETARPIDVPGRTLSSVESPQSYLERSRAQIMVNDSPHTPTSQSVPFRPSHLRNLSGVSSCASSFVETRKHAGSVSSLDASPNASGVHLPKDEISGTPPGGGAGTEPMFNFRSLAAMIGDEDKRAASPLVEHTEYVNESLPDLSQDEIDLSASPEGEHPPAQIPTASREIVEPMEHKDSSTLQSKEMNISTNDMPKDTAGAV